MQPDILDLTPRFRAAYGLVPMLKPGINKVPGAQYANLYTVDLYVAGAQNFEELRLVNETYDVDMLFGGYRMSKSGALGDYFAPPPMLSFHKAKAAITTTINGLDDANEIVELYNGGAWEVKMQGIIVDMKDHHFPLDKISQLDYLFRVPGGFEVSSQLMDALGITTIWFPEVDITPVQGYSDTVQFSMTGRSIKAVEFFLNGDEE